MIYPERDMAINPGRVFGEVKGIATRDPAFGMEAVWIEPTDRDHAQSMGYTVVDAGTVIATHLSHIIQSHAYELLGHEEVSQLLANVAKSAPKLVEDLVPKVLPMAVLVRVLQSLLAERVPLRNMRAIVETLAEQAPRSQDPAVLQAAVRVALGRQIVQDIAGMVGESAGDDAGSGLGTITARIYRQRQFTGDGSGTESGGAAADPPGGRRTAAGTDGGARGAAGPAALATDAGPFHSRERPEHACFGLERDSGQPQSPAGFGGRSMMSKHEVVGEFR